MTREINIDGTWFKADGQVVKRMQENYETLKLATSKYDELAYATKEVRRLQKLYFKSKAYNILDECKKAEQELDDILSGKNQSTQQALF